ncbi:MAG: FAD-dependent oxidoreductase, partial [Candidatus Hodarchaeota archaeon]
MERYDVVVIGAGPAGSSAALVLARSGLSVLLVERGKAVGSKNVFGGRIYSYPLFDLIADWKKDCPIERFITKDILSFMTGNQSLTVQYDSPHLVHGKSASFTAFRPNFDNWLARKAENAGTTLITGIKVDDLWLEDGWTKGIIAGNDKVGADVVIAADGVVSKFSQKVGLRSEMIPEMVSVGVKETIELPATTIQERFNLEEGEGAACVFVGQPSGGLGGGGFLYTNKNSVSLGIVVSSNDLSLQKIEIHALQEGFKRHPMLSRLLKGGKILEYSSHMIPELGVKTIEKAYSDGFLVAGDAAGFLINNGYSFRGIDLA